MQSNKQENIQRIIQIIDSKLQQLCEAFGSELAFGNELVDKIIDEKLGNNNKTVKTPKDTTPYLDILKNILLRFNFIN